MDLRFSNFLIGFVIIFVTFVHSYKVGVGRADVTGPVAEIGFMGYAKTSQKGMGLHLRQYSRAFIIEKDDKRLTFVTVDVCMIGPAIRKEVLKRLEKKFGNNNIYNEQNVIISGTHTHSGPGGFLMHLLFDISILGFVRQTFKAHVNGITRSILIAHASMVESRIFINSGELLDANINRSPAAYLLNPEEERNEFKYDVDKDMNQMKFISIATNKTLGIINWFAIHPTSMNNTNRLVSSDNVGYASILLEKHFDKDHQLVGKGDFVGAFASTNLGDVSPNIKGPHCQNNGKPCQFVDSTCDGQARLCVASGPGKNMFESTKIIANRLFEKAKELFENGKETEIKGGLRVGHRFVFMPNQTAKITTSNGTVFEVKGCFPAMGYSFAAGTTDGPGEFDFTQGTTTENKLWNLVRDLLSVPTEEDKKCHHPKPILLNTGKINFPYEWQPKIVSVQVAILGDVVIAAVPGEFTTMSGRRLRKTISNVFQTNDKEIKKVIVAGLSNVYTDYIATPEEYQLQRYEGASTIFGPHTLTIYLKLFQQLTESLLQNKTIDPGPTPTDFPDDLLTLNPPVIFDSAGFNSNFGQCTSQPEKQVRRGNGNIVKAIFVSGNPRNDLMHGKTFLSVEKLEAGNWNVIATDSDWETKFIWDKSSKFSPISEATIEWEITPNTKSGKYRIRHFGYYKNLFGGTYPYEGLSDDFEVID